MLKIWGKWSGLTEPLPLLAHLLDTAAVSWVAWDQWGVRVQRNATALLAPGDSVLARCRFAILAAAHDCGKCSREFQQQAWSPRESDFAAQTGELREAGLPMTVPASRPVLVGPERSWLRHEAVSVMVLADQTALPSWARRVVAGHHGRYQPTGPQRLASPTVSALRDRASEPAWAAAQRALLDDVAAAVSTQADVATSWSGWPDTVARGLVPFIPVLTGLVCVCDWVASDDAFVAAAPVTLLEAANHAAYLRHRVGDATRALEGVLVGNGTPSGSFAELFAGREPRGDAQKWAAGRRHDSGLTLVMAPMGEGKTEVALLMHATDGGVGDGQQAGDGLFFGLPTMATADAMFARVQQFWAGTGSAGRLAHSQAVLHDFYAPSNLRPTGICADGDGEGLQPADWFGGRHRGLLAPVTVGTCDQVLAAALDHKFLPVRLAGIAGKHIVLDEIHTYDPYQQRLLCRLLGWLGAYRCRVTLLSATLPRARVGELSAAWTRGWHGAPAAAVVTDLLSHLPTQMPYPAVVSVGDTLVCQPLQAWRKFDVQVRSHLLPDRRPELLAATVDLVRVLRLAQPAARIGLIVNTVDRAIALYEALATGMPGEVLLHSRMTAGQRRERTAQLHGLLGEQAPAGSVLMVATQVAEASLDLDLDLLVTDLCPMASLLQRIGRMWRHSVNVGDGWSHPAHLQYREGQDPVVHVLAPVDDDGVVAAGFAALPYTTAELRRAWSEPACLDGGQRKVLSLPGDLQAAVDAAHLTFDALASDAAAESPETQEILRFLAKRLVDEAAGDANGHRVTAIAKTWKPSRTGPDPFGRDEPDWHRLTAPTLWDDANGVVTRLRERDQAQILLYDPTGRTEFAWTGEPATLLVRSPPRPTLLAALAATVPVSGSLASRLRELAGPFLPAGWADLAPPLLRGLTPVPVSALTGLAALDPTLGLIRLETA